MNPWPFVRASLTRNPFTVVLFILLIALAVAMGVVISAQERAMRLGSARAADKFDLIIGAPGSQTDLLLSAVFLRPTAVELLPGPVAARVLSDPDAALAAPIAFGDSYEGKPVVGTTAAFVEHLSGGLAEGRVFGGIEEAVVGALVEEPLGARLEIRHGLADDLTGGQDADAYEDDHDHDHGAEDQHDHDDAHLHEDVLVIGRMKPTGTPWDRAVIVPVEYVWQAHAMGTGHAIGDERIGPPWEASLVPGLPAIIVRPDSVASAYGLRARYRTAETMAFFPAETLVELYDLMGRAARIMSGLTLAAQAMVLAAILSGLLAVLDLQRQRFAVLRALGASAFFVFLTVWAYVAVMVVVGGVLGLGLGWLAAAFVSARLSEATGVVMSAAPGAVEFGMAGLLLLLGLLLAVIPAFRAYRASAVEGLR